MSHDIVPTQYYPSNTDFDFYEKSTFESGLLFLREKAFVSNLSFFINFGQTLIPECVYRP